MGLTVHDITKSPKVQVGLLNAALYAAFRAISVLNKQTRKSEH